MTTKRLAAEPDEIAPDGSEVRELVRGQRGGLAHFSLSPGAVSVPTMHKTVEELWYVLAGVGEMVVGTGPPVSLSERLSIVIPPMTRFQFRNTGSLPLEILGATMPIWPGVDEALEAAAYWDQDGNVVIRP